MVWKNYFSQSKKFFSRNSSIFYRLIWIKFRIENKYPWWVAVVVLTDKLEKYIPKVDDKFEAAFICPDDRGFGLLSGIEKFDNFVGLLVHSSEPLHKVILSDFLSISKNIVVQFSVNIKKISHYLHHDYQ